MIRRLILFAGLAAAAAVGCGRTASTPQPAAMANQSATKPAGEEGHAHAAGAHGGTIVPVGRDSYHVEAVFGKDGTVRLYTLGQDEARVQEVEAQELAAFVTPAGGPESQEVTFRPDPQSGDAPGKTSRFAATLPEGLRGKAVRVTVTSLRVGGERFRVEFGNEPADAEMPAKKAGDEEAALFLTPGGLYTEADVRANGGTVPAEKYRGIRPTHDDSPKPGDVICPISKTKANPKFTWVVGGKTYEFCCVPCIEEFVAKAKESPAEVKDPEAYRKK